MKKLGRKLPPIQNRRLRNKYQKEDNEIKRRLIDANQYLNYWKFQIHWNKLERVNPRSRDEQKNQFCVSSKKIKDSVKTGHWVDQSQLRYLDIDYLFKRTLVVDEKRASVTVNTPKQSVSRGGENPVLLQEEEENAACPWRS